MRRSENTVELKIHHEGKVDAISAEKNASLLQVLIDNGYEIYSPCGGNGTCGKCKVWLKGEGSVAACVYRVASPLEIILPDRKEARILVEQHAHTLQGPFMPGPAVGLSSFPHGIALDLGTTTLVLYLLNLVTGTLVETRAVLNPQSRYGSDVISRINYSAGSKGGLRELQDVIIGSINVQLDHFCGKAGISPDDIVKIAVSGNTTMLHLLLGVDPLPIALAPFSPRFTDEQLLSGKDLGLHCHPEGEIKLLPSISAYVGADIVGGLASIKSEEGREHYLFMDIGTNGELALVGPDGIICCSAAAGPAFEGARISCGMGGLEGAISAFGSRGYTVIGDIAPTGICGSGLIDVVAYLVENGIIGKDGQLKEDYIVADGNDTMTGKIISISQQDIREVQLAKSAIAAGVEVLMKHGGLDFNDIDTIFLAGGFGNYINPESAMKIGLIPPELSGKIIPLGNTSGTGAMLSLKSTRFDEAVKSVRDRARYIELSGHEDFTEAFALNMDF